MSSRPSRVARAQASQPARLPHVAILAPLSSLPPAASAAARRLLGAGLQRTAARESGRLEALRRQSLCRGGRRYVLAASPSYGACHLACPLACPPPPRPLLQAVPARGRLHSCGEHCLYAWVYLGLQAACRPCCKQRPAVAAAAAAGPDGKARAPAASASLAPAAPAKPAAPQVCSPYRLPACCIGSALVNGLQAQHSTQLAVLCVRSWLTHSLHLLCSAGRRRPALRARRLLPRPPNARHRPRRGRHPGPCLPCRPWLCPMARPLPTALTSSRAARTRRLPGSQRACHRLRGGPAPGAGPSGWRPPRLPASAPRFQRLPRLPASAPSFAADQLLTLFPRVAPVQPDFSPAAAALPTAKRPACGYPRLAG